VPAARAAAVGLNQEQCRERTEASRALNVCRLRSRNFFLYLRNLSAVTDGYRDITNKTVNTLARAYQLLAVSD